MTARPIRRNAQTPDRNGKIFYTSTTSLSHISKKSRHETGNGELNVKKQKGKAQSRRKRQSQEIFVK